MWNALYEELIRPTTGGTQYSKPTDKTIAVFERESHVKLPESYKEFTKVFGAGELAEYYRIAAPLDIEDDNDLVRQNRNAHGEPGEDLLGSYGPSEVTDRIVIFGNTIGGEMFGWNTEEVTDEDRAEYAIFYLTRRGSMERIANTFEEFVQHCLTQEPDKNGYVPPRTFFSY